MEDESLFQVGETVEFWRVLVHLSVLALCLVLFEKALHRLERNFPPSDKYQHMLKKVYRELMTLGLISLGLKIFKEVPSFDSEGKPMIAFEVADLAIFLLALTLILQSAAIFLMLRNQNDRADRAELVTTRGLAQAITSTDSEDMGPSFVQTLFCCGRVAKRKSMDKELVELRLLRRLFLRRFGLPQLFPFATYLSRAQASQISLMIEVEPSMWIALLAVAWSICGVLRLLKALDGTIPARQELVEAFFMIAWILLLLHFIVCLYFRTCVHYLLRVAAFSEDKTVLSANLNAIAEEEEKAWRSEEADKALRIMCSIQEQHEELHCRRQLVAGSPELELRFFSHEVWHATVMLLLILNGFLVNLFVQCVVYDLDEIYDDFGALPTIVVPLPLVLNTVVFQRRIFYDFVVISNILRVDSRVLSDVVENFGDVIQLRSEFGTSLLQQITQRQLSVMDLEAELKARDPSGSGLIGVEDLRVVLAKFGVRLTRFRFNSVVKLLFELEGMALAYSQVIRLVLMAKSESHAARANFVGQHQPLPLLRSRNFARDNFGAPSQSNYNLFSSTKQLPPSNTEPKPNPSARMDSRN
ncbi:hypothetical protein PHYSODRAFT_482113 [Phytophthora sojae]|uniref:EF-hand domain-containing protein n=1 Tax=Phytophthora sojae (strain P6497) TaxID=1094619 RepID=G4YWV7_PHYSP|nr:hypothetical protein PHYSODRAFT_482113 [Phytophthora sojae]EGZ24455.1 hypothetical protein PHYSODRAFT_482113 [Phytophthora sojae]|eukprot:XP_009519743.1 hypothetical protein PHYSODRAFT_482113 [Phytophthora sojae]